MTEIEIALIKMGYRLQADNFWAKPVGDMIFCYSCEKKEIVSFFKGADDKIHINDSCLLYEDFLMLEKSTSPIEKEFLLFLKHFERYTTINRGEPSSFEFLTKEEYYNTLL